ncbi:MAG: PTS glucose transporter subunit IIA [Velocimicrobium sp.]
MKNNRTIFSPVDGEIIPKNQVKDEVFRKEFFGKGISIYPSSNKIVSPVSGIIESIAKDGHSVIIKADCGVRIWIYIGADIVELNGIYIEKFVEDKKKVKVGTLLLDCDFYEMEKLRYDIEITITVLQQENIFEVIQLKEGRIKRKKRVAGILFHHIDSIGGQCGAGTVTAAL